MKESARSHVSGVDPVRDGSPEAAGAPGERPQPGFAVPGFDAVARMVAGRLDVQWVVLVLADGDAYWFAPAGDDGRTIALPPLLRGAAERRQPLVMRDLREHADGAGLQEAFARPVRFLASEPVLTLAGTHVGALCVLDPEPRRGLGEDEAATLRDGAALIGHGVVLRSYLGRTDPTTQLPNRAAFFEDLHERLDGGGGRVPLAAVEVSPVARFNAFVRAMGHNYSDLLMRLVGARLGAWIGTAGHHLYQVGATRFAIVFGDDAPLHDEGALDALLHDLREPFDCDGIPLSIQPGVGLLHVDLAELRRGDPLRRVMSASFAALQSARGWLHYRADADDHHRQEFFLVTELSAALSQRGGHDGSELQLHYQPRVDLDSGRCVAVEALARWRHPSLGYISPAQFVPLAERSALMHALTDWVIETAVAQLGRWHGAGHRIRLSINVSSNDCQMDLDERLARVAEHHGVPLDMLELEFTESTLLQHGVATSERLEQLRRRGIGVAIDDFGTGYSNLAYLRRMPASTLKIDQSFVRSIMHSPDDATIVSSVARMARKLGFRVVVEGVETESIFNAVKAMECDEVQGYFLARPLPPEQLQAWLEDHASRPLPGRI
jgi:EAL domain-containing protein (putative c-di-GMP-specific phosphodiesterase class I)/GGDEF domain-containing protein